MAAAARRPVGSSRVTVARRTPQRGPHDAAPSVRRPPRSDSLVMLGVTGDLAKKKLIPAVYRLHERGLLDIPVVGLARPDWSHVDLANHVRGSLEDTGEKFDNRTLDELLEQWRYVSGDYEDPRRS